MTDFFLCVWCCPSDKIEVSPSFFSPDMGFCDLCGEYKHLFLAVFNPLPFGSNDPHFQNDVRERLVTFCSGAPLSPLSYGINSFLPPSFGFRERAIDNWRQSWKNRLFVVHSLRFSEPYVKLYSAFLHSLFN